MANGFSPADKAHRHPSQISSPRSFSIRVDLRLPVQPQTVLVHWHALNLSVFYLLLILIGFAVFWFCQNPPNYFRRRDPAGTETHQPCSSIGGFRDFLLRPAKTDNNIRVMTGMWRSSMLLNDKKASGEERYAESHQLLPTRYCCFRNGGRRRNENKTRTHPRLY